MPAIEKVDSLPLGTLVYWGQLVSYYHKALINTISREILAGEVCVWVIGGLIWHCKLHRKPKSTVQHAAGSIMLD